MNATLLAIATTLSGIIVFMKNEKKTSRAATHAAMTIAIAHLASRLMPTTSSHLLTARRRMRAQAGVGAGGVACSSPRPPVSTSDRLTQRLKLTICLEYVNDQDAAGASVA